MDISSHKSYIKVAYEKYKKINYVECPAFTNEKVYFLKRGFRHLIWKGTKLRDIDEQIDRLSLLRYVPDILKSSNHFKDFNKNKLHNQQTGTRVNFWSFSGEYNQIKITVVIRQINDGPKHFFSVMRRHKKHKTP